MGDGIWANWRGECVCVCVLGRGDLSIVVSHCAFVTQATSVIVGILGKLVSFGSVCFDTRARQNDRWL